MPDAIAIAAPRAEEAMRTGVATATGFGTGLAVGMIAKVAPQFGAAAPFLTWGSLLVTPVIGIAGALFTRGMLSDALIGVAAGGAAALGYAVPGLLPELGIAKKAPQLTAEQRAALAAGVKQLPPGAAFAPQRQQAQVAAGITAEI